MGSDLTPEQVFLKYAFPCAHIILEKKDISHATFAAIKNSVYKGEKIDKEKLEEIFPVAFERLRESSEKAKLDYWTIEAIRHYFRNCHGDYIDNNSGNYKMFGDTLKDLCRVRKVTVKKIIKENIAEVEVDSKPRPIFLNLIPDAKPGDEIYIHYSFAVEKA